MRFPIISALCCLTSLSILDIQFVNAKGSKGRPWSPAVAPAIVTTPNTPVITPSFFPPVPVAETPSIAPAVVSPNTPVNAPSNFPPAPVADTPSIAPAVISPNTPVNAPSNFPPAPVGVKPSVDLVSPVNIPQPSLCEINPAKNLVTVLSETSDKFKACGENIEEVKNTIERVNEALNTVRNITNLFNETIEELEDFERMMQSMSVFTDMIPKIGKVIKRMRGTMKKLQKTFEKGLKPIEGNLAKMDAAFQNVTSNLEKVETITKSGGEHIEMIRKPLNTAVSCIERNQCFLEEPMKAIADFVPTEPFEEVVQPPLDVCSVVFGELSKIDVPIINLSDFDPIHDIQGVMRGMRDFVSTVVGGVFGAVLDDETLCCSDILKPIKFIAETAVDLIDLVKCWIPAKSAIGASVDAVLQEVLSALNPLASGLFTAFENFNTLLSAIKNAQVSDVNITFSFDLAVDEITCELDVTGNIGVEAELSNATNLSSVVDIENIDFDGEDFSLIDICGRNFFRVHRCVEGCV